MCPVCSTVRVVRLPPSGGELSLCAVAELNPWVCGPERQRDGDAERRRGGGWAGKRFFLKIILTFRKFGLSLCALKMIRALK